MSSITPLLLVSLSVLAAFAHGAALQDEYVEIEDMVLTKEQKEFYDEMKSGSRHRRAALRDAWLWPNGIIPYEFDPTVDRFGRNLARAAMREWMDNTCLQFISRSRRRPQRAFIRFQYDDAEGKCKANLGWNGGQTNVWMGRRPRRGRRRHCFHGRVVHEIGHSVGFFHEHNRLDRDRFVRINTGNIRPGSERSFEMVDARLVDSRGEPYDYDSIMHYHPMQGNNAPGARVLEPVDQVAGANMGQRDGLSPGDIAQTRRMYNCRANDKIKHKPNLRGGHK